MNRHELRIGDQERDAAVSALGEHYVAGRLTKEEFDERSAVAWQGRTSSDLAPLFYDLPPLPAPQRPAPAAPASKAMARTTRGRSGGVPVIPVLMLVLIVALASELPVWPLLLLLVVYLWVRVSFWRGQARRQARRGRHPAAGDPWRQWHRP
jgi:Domain of unknown function (DUF1707)